MADWIPFIVMTDRIGQHLDKFTFDGPISMLFSVELVHPMGGALPSEVKLICLMRTWDSTQVRDPAKAVGYRIFPREHPKATTVVNSVNVALNVLFHFATGELDKPMLERQVKLLASDAWRHEFMEWLRFDGKRVENPHPEEPELIAGLSADMLIVDDPLGTK